MTTRKLLTLATLPLFLVGCLDSDDGGSSMKEEDRARAAAQASVITGSVNNPDDDDSGSGMTPLMVMQGHAPLKMEPCQISGEVTSGSGTENVGSPWTSSGEVSISWTEYVDCVQGASGSEYEFDGYTATGTAEAGAVSYSGWSSARGDGIDLSNRFVLDWPDGRWSFAGEMHNCDNCSMGSLNAFEGFMEWEIQAQGETATFSYGEPNNYIAFSASGQSGGQAQQTVSGNFGVNWQGTPCQFDVNYNTVSPLVINNYGTSSQVTVGGELDITLNGGSGSTYTITWDADGNAYIDGQLIDPNETTACSGVFDLMSTSAGF